MEKRRTTEAGPVNFSTNVVAVLVRFGDGPKGVRTKPGKSVPLDLGRQPDYGIAALCISSKKASDARASRSIASARGSLLIPE
jgi:hypothetical protein